MKDAHDNLLYSDVAADGTILQRDDDDDDDNDDESRLDEVDDGDVDDGANNAIYDLASRVAASQSADSLLSDATSGFRHVAHDALLQQQQRSDMTTSMSHATCLGGAASFNAAAAAVTSSPSTSGLATPLYPTAERKALPRMGAKTLKLKSPSTSCISRGAALSVAEAASRGVGDDLRGAVVASNDSLLSPASVLSPALSSGVADKMKESLTDSGCSIDATPASPTDTIVKQGTFPLSMCQHRPRTVSRNTVPHKCFMARWRV